MCEKHSGDGLFRIGCLAFPVPYFGGKSFGCSLSRAPLFSCTAEKRRGKALYKIVLLRKKIFFSCGKKVPAAN